MNLLQIIEKLFEINANLRNLSLNPTDGNFMIQVPPFNVLKFIKAETIDFLMKWNDFGNLDSITLISSLFISSWKTTLYHIGKYEFQTKGGNYLNPTERWQEKIINILKSGEIWAVRWGGANMQIQETVHTQHICLCYIYMCFLLL